MVLWRSIPFACILLPLAAAAPTSVLKGRGARRAALGVLAVETLLSLLFVPFMIRFDGSYTYMMGHFPAPWGNEIRAGAMEAVAGLLFSLVMLLSAAAGARRQDNQILPDRLNLYYVMILLLTSALMAQVYPHDLFTGYVFVEIMTLTGCSLIVSRSGGKTLVAGTRYMIMNLLGSGLFLLGVVLLYDLTGHLLMENIREKVEELAATGAYHLPLTVVVALMFTGLSVKGALFPFHTWVPDAYSSGTPSSAAILSSLVSKGYIFLLMKIMYRVIGPVVTATTGMTDVLFVFGLCGTVLGSLAAIQQTDIRLMISYSSVAQIGYIYMGIGLSSDAGMVAAFFHIIAHSVCKSMLFFSADTLCASSGNFAHFRDLRGAGLRSPLAGVAFTVGALSMVGFPFLGGFVSKLNLAHAAIGVGGRRCILALAALAVSSLLNTMYFLRTVTTLYRSGKADAAPDKGGMGPLRKIALICFIGLNLFLGLFSSGLFDTIRAGLQHFG